METNKLFIKTIDITIDDNPSTWTEASFAKYIKSDELAIVGYLFKNKTQNKKDNLDLSLSVNLYLINKKRAESEYIITLNQLNNVFLQWIESLMENNKSFMFKNPPLDLWLETKDNWMKKLANKLSTTYNRPYDECYSSMCFVITELYAKKTVYMGSLYYISVSVHNQMKREYRYMLNRLHGGHPDAVHLDARFDDFGVDSEDNIVSLHEVVIGVEDDLHKNEKLNDNLDRLIEDLKLDFSEREIDQIINQSKFLPMSLYRRLLKWRKTHKMEDYL